MTGTGEIICQETSQPEQKQAINDSPEQSLQRGGGTHRVHRAGDHPGGPCSSTSVARSGGRPAFPTVFEARVNGIACQQLSLSVGIHLLNRLTAAHGRPVIQDPMGARAFLGPDPRQRILTRKSTS
jgi:hypothetical protein